MRLESIKIEKCQIQYAFKTKQLKLICNLKFALPHYMKFNIIAKDILVRLIFKEGSSVLYCGKYQVSKLGNLGIQNN